MKKVLAIITVVALALALCVSSFAALDCVYVNVNTLQFKDSAVDAGYVGDSTINIDPGDKIYILGWAVKNGTNLDYVYWTVDGEAKSTDGTDSYLPRPDVAGVLQVSADYAQRSSIGANTAMMELLGADELANGKYSCTIVAKYQNEETEILKAFTLQVGPAAEKTYKLVPGTTTTPYFWLTNDGDYAAVEFTTLVDFNEISVPNTWATREDQNREATVVLSLYAFKYNAEYSMTLAPVATTTYTTVMDGYPACVLSLGDFVSAGTYIFEIKTVGEKMIGDTATGGYFVLDKPAADADEDYFKYSGTSAKQFAFAIIGKNTDGDVVTVNPEDTDVPTAPVYKNASFDSIYVDGALNFGQADGAASDKLDGVNRTVGNGDGSISEIRLRGWIGFEQEIELFGYKIGNAEPVFDASFTEATEPAVKAAGGDNALRFNVTVPVAGIEGEQKVVMVVKLKTGDVVEIDDTLVATGPATAPNTSFTFVGTPAQNPPTADASMVIFVIAAAAIALVVLKKKVF